MDTIYGNIVIVGAGGYWGSIFIRAALEVFDTDHVVAFDVDETTVMALAKRLKKQNVISSITLLKQSTNMNEVLSDDNNKYFVIATPPKSHHQISIEVLRHKKHILIAKPLALNSKDAEEINNLATEQGVVAMVDHTFIFHPAVSALIAETKAGAIGVPKTFYANWLSRGKIQDGSDVIWDLAPHPLSILLEFWKFPIDVSCKVLDSIDGTVTEASLFLTEKDTGNSATINVSWMDSDKSRTFKIRGSHHAIIFDDMQEIGTKLRIKGGKTIGQSVLSEGYDTPVRDIEYPEQETITFDWEEPIKKELYSFVAMAEQPDGSNSCSIINDVRAGMSCVKLIEAAQRSIATGEVVHER